MSLEILKMRLKRLQEQLKERAMDAVLITNAINRAYISGFVGTAGYAIITPEDAFLLTDFRYTQQAKKQAPCFKVMQFEGKPYKALQERLHQSGVKALGFEDNTVTYAQYRDFEKELNVETLIPVRDLLTGLRQVKDGNEIAKMRKAANIGDRAFSHILKFIKVGMTEREIALELEFFMKRSGATALAFDTIVVSGARSALPHGQPTQKKIEFGDLVTMDFGCVYEGYCSDMTRTVGMGRLDDTQRKIYNVVWEAQESALAQLGSGKTGKEVDRIARDIIEGNGYGKCFGHGLGHAVGREVHENPRLSPLGEDVLKPGMVVTVEPGIYVEDFGGVRIEDMVVITEDGIENLTSSPKDLILV